MPAAIGEAARVLAPGGHLTLSIVHPFVDRGALADDGLDAAFEITGSYLGRKHFTGTDQHGEHVMHYAGWSHPLQDYAAASRTRAWRSPRSASPVQRASETPPHVRPLAAPAAVPVGQGHASGMT